jgi:tetratricopeptide (TPR) repeat protein
MGFGEVDLGGGDASSSDDDMEFGAIPQESAGGRDAGYANAPSEGALPSKLRDLTAEEVAEVAAKPKKKSNAGKVALAIFVVLGLAGGSLEFTKYGAFGRNFINDYLKRDAYAKLQTDDIQRTRDAFGEDNIGRSAEAVAALAVDVEKAPRYSSLLAYAAYAHFAHELRFGKDGALEQKAGSLLGRAIVDSPQRRLAFAARDAVAGGLPSARAELANLLREDPKNVDAAWTLGEVEMRAKQYKDAIAAFQKAKDAKDSPRSRSGLMRAYDAAGETDKAKEEAKAVAAKSPNHVPSRLYLAHIAWEKDKDEKGALEILYYSL